VTRGGTALYDGLSGVPDLVRRAVEAAADLHFDLCVHPATGRLLAVLAAGVPAGGRVGETGTGTGAGLGWMADANPNASFVSVEHDGARADAARQIFEPFENVEVVTGDAGLLFERGPFDLLVHDGGWGSGKNDPRRVDPSEVLTANGVMTIDDYTPMSEWPPSFMGQPDRARADWLGDNRLLATEVTVADGMAVLVCRRRPPLAGPTGVELRNQRSGSGAICRAILDRLPTWFGIAEANDEYVAAAESSPCVIASLDGSDVGILTLVHHSADAAEVHLMAVIPEMHRRGIGRAMLRHAEAQLLRAGVHFLQVKTLSPRRVDEGYASTRAFYEAYGFRHLEEFPTLWSPENPALQMVKVVGR
jgi:predicted O-methyltransferase YrrM/GNAT superfamily N-acetyltransferase